MSGSCRASICLGDSGSDVLTTRPVYIAFDVLYARGRDLRARPLEERRDVLERLVEGAHLVFPARRLSGDGKNAWEEVLARGIEGYVGKDPSSTYLSGGPTRSWLKAKVRHEGRFIVGGVVKRTEGWSLLLGTIQNGGLSYRGLVHFGVGQRLADALASKELVRSTSPFSERVPVRGVTWLDPHLVAEVTYSDLTPAGILRAPVFRGFADEGASRLT
jgi:bifunctional non-homologous end joining protein LigD